MEIKVTYSDFEKEIRKSKIEFCNEGNVINTISLKFSDDIEGCPIIETEVNGKIPTIDTTCDKTEPRDIIMTCSDGIVDIENTIPLDDFLEIIKLMQRMANLA